MLKSKIILTAAILVGLWSCSGGKDQSYEKEMELNMLDSLGAQLAEVKGWLDEVSLEEIVARKTAINSNYEYLDEKYKALNIDPDEETVRRMDEYKALGKVYMQVQRNYPAIVTELEQLINQVHTLKQSVIAGDYDKETFKRYYAQEKRDVDKLHGVARAFLKNAIDTEPIFERRNSEVQQMLSEVSGK